MSPRTGNVAQWFRLGRKGREGGRGREKKDGRAFSRSTVSSSSSGTSVTSMGLSWFLPILHICFIRNKFPKSKNPHTKHICILETSKVPGSTPSRHPLSRIPKEIINCPQRRGQLKRKRPVYMLIPQKQVLLLLLDLREPEVERQQLSPHSG